MVTIKLAVRVITDTGLDRSFKWGIVDREKWVQSPKLQDEKFSLELRFLREIYFEQRSQTEIHPRALPGDTSHVTASNQLWVASLLFEHGSQKCSLGKGVFIHSTTIYTTFHTMRDALVKNKHKRKKCAQAGLHCSTLQKGGDTVNMINNNAITQRMSQWRGMWWRR